MSRVRHPASHHATHSSSAKTHSSHATSHAKHQPAHSKRQGRHGHTTKDTFQPASAHRASGRSSGQVSTWVAQAQQILAAHGVPMSKMNASDIALIIRHESGGNPNAQNNWDSNAKAGHPSIGLMQTIGPTFEHYKLPGHDNIRNPVDNIIAGVRYAISRYGSISNVPGVRDVHAGRKYVGY